MTTGGICYVFDIVKLIYQCGFTVTTPTDLNFKLFHKKGRFASGYNFSSHSKYLYLHCLFRGKKGWGYYLKLLASRSLCIDCSKKIDKIHFLFSSLSNLSLTILHLFVSTYSSLTLTYYYTDFPTHSSNWCL